MDKKSQNIIMGIDPGTRITGYGILQKEPLKVLDFGCIVPPPKAKLEKRLLTLSNTLQTLIEKYHPSAISTETQFVKKNITSAMKLVMARGIVMLAAAKNEIPFYEYAPKKAKKALTGNGSASKLQMQKMVQTLFSLSSLPEPEDAADALALALCHSHYLNLECVEI